MHGYVPPAVVASASWRPRQQRSPGRRVSHCTWGAWPAETQQKEWQTEACNK